MIKLILKRSILVLLSLVVAISIATTSFTTQASAKNCDYQFYNDNDFGEWYDPCDVDCGGEAGAGSITLQGATNLEKIWNWLVAKGLSPTQAAGVMGNMQAESGLNPFRFQNGATKEGMWQYDGNIKGYNKHAWGLVQWDGPRRIDQSGTKGVLGKLKTEAPQYIEYIDPKYGNSADAFSNAPLDVNEYFITFELEYMFAEASPGGNRSTVWADLKGTTTVLDATVLFHNQFEGSADTPEQVQQGRGANAQAIYDEMASQSAIGGGSCDPKPDGSIVYYSQHDPKWDGVMYSGGSLDDLGCGPTSMAIILASLVDPSITPPDVGAVAGEQSDGTSSWYNLITGVSAKWGVTITSQITMDEAVEFVKSGKGYVWIGGAGPAPFTNGGHMVAMVGVTENGAITIADPHNPPHDQIKDYDREIIETYSAGRFGVSK